MPSKNARLQQWLNYRVRVALLDSRVMVGTFLAFDRHMNVVLVDTEEYRKVRMKKQVEGKGVVVEEKEMKRTIGLVLLRGENICTFIAEAPPQQQPRRPTDPSMMGAGVGTPVGRGVGGLPLGAPPVGLSGPVRGVGGPAPHQMMGQIPAALGRAGPGVPPPGAPGAAQPGMMVPPVMRPPGMM